MGGEQHGSVGVGAAAESSPVEHRRHGLLERGAEQLDGQLVELVGVLAGAEHPGLHVAVGGDGLRSALQHQSGGAPCAQVPDHPDAGAGRRLDAQHGRSRVLGGPGDEADHAARVLVVVVAGHRDPACRVARAEESLHMPTIASPAGKDSLTR